MNSNRVRAWLRLNKIFFETVAALLLSLMAILVSVAQTRSAAQQTELLRQQTRISETQVVPQFSVRIEQGYDPDTDSYPNEDLVVDNNGGIAREWSVSTAEFLVTTCIQRDQATPLTAEVPINGYYAVAFKSSRLQGSLYRVQGFGNNRALLELKRNLRKSAVCEFGDTDIERYVRISYDDVLGRNHSDFFLVAPVSGAEQLTKEVGRAAFQRWFEGGRRQTLLEFSEITAEDLLRSAISNDKRPGA